MIDLHCHLAYGVDDGPHNAEESLDLAKALQDAGVTDVAVTSHLRRDKKWINDRSVQDENHKNLNQILENPNNNLNLKIYQGAEHYIDELIVETAQNNLVVPYSNSNWLLIELPYAGKPPRMLETLHNIRLAGYKILLAHLERFEYVVEYPELVEKLFDSGYAIQINLGSLCGAYHRKHKKYSRWLLQEGFAHVAASDCHRWKDVKKCVTKGLYALEKLSDSEEVKRLTVDNPRKILDNKSFDELE